MSAAILWLDEIREGDRERAGAKAFTLAVLRRQGLPVPDGFVLPADAPAEDALVGYRHLGGDVAVRSSSSAEDLEGASFAGQYRTVLGVIGEADLLAAVRDCRDSARAAAGYRRLMGAPEGRLAVLVQRMVSPRAAGVVFTRHPADAGRILVEAHAGGGEAVVAGTTVPDRYVLDRGTGALREGPSAGSLGASDLAAVRDLALKVESLAGAPQDVEWAIGREGPVLLQSRPITVEVEDVPDPRIRRLTRANVGEVLPDAVTPLTWSTVGSFLEHGFRSATAAAGLLPPGAPAFLVLHRRRLYLNLSLCLEAAARLPGVSPAAAEALILGGGGAAGAAPRPSAFALGVGVRLLRIARRLPGEVAAAAESVPRLAGPAAVDAAGERGLIDLLDRFEETGREVARVHVAVSGSCGFRLALLARLLEGFRPGDTPERLNRLLAGLEDVASVAPALALEQLGREATAHPEWRSWLAAATPSLETAPPGLGRRLREFLGRFGHRAVAEGELAAPTWADDPLPVFRALRALAQSDEGAAFRRRAAAATRAADEEALLAPLGPVRRSILRHALAGSRAAVRERERTKELSIRLVDHGRRLARAAARHLVAAGRLGRADDVFFLTVDELRRAFAGARPSSALVARRRRHHEREGALVAPREVDLEATAVPDADEGTLRGTPVSPGVGGGRARVLEAGDTLEPGEVLVARVLDAAHGPLLAVASAAVAEIGGLLSHGAVVARELGIPCVVDVRGATHLLRTGDQIVVDGGSGLVTRAEAAGASDAAATLPVLEPEDTTRETLHALEDHPLARESVYLNVQDSRARLYLVASVGRRREGRGEALLAFRIGEGPLRFGLELAPAVTDRGLAVGGMGVAFSPFRLRVKTRLASHEPEGFPVPPVPLLLTPRTVECTLDLAFDPTTPAVDFCRGLPAGVLESLAPLGAHHLEQSGTWSGHVEVDGVRHAIRGTGSRDHSWGRRSWDAADHWRLFTARLLPRSGPGREIAVHALVASVRGRRIEGGFVSREGRLERVVRVLYVPEETDGALVALDLRVTTDRGETLRLRGVVERTLTVPVDVERRPLRHLAGRPYRLLLHENFTRYECGTHAGSGIAEFTARPL